MESSELNYLQFKKELIITASVNLLEKLINTLDNPCSFM